MSYATIQQINSGIMFGNLTNDELDSVVMAVKYARAQLGKARMRSINVGSQVTFFSTRRNTTVSGLVKKIGRKYVTVEDQSNRVVWNVPANMLAIAD
jgi:uncharacterized protein YqjF (DUF2071 family)